MQTSPAGLDLIKRFEGLELEAYQDIAGVWTIGYGHTGPDVAPSASITAEAAEALLLQDVATRERTVRDLVTVPLSQGQFDALVSFVYNVGAGKFRASTALRRLNAGDYVGAAEALTWWNKATVDGRLREVTGLTRRRAAEAEMFLAATDRPDRSTFDENDDDGIVVAPGRSAEAPPQITPPEGRACGWELFGHWRRWKARQKETP